MDRKKLFVSWSRYCIFLKGIYYHFIWSLCHLYWVSATSLIKEEFWSVFCRPDITQRNSFLIFWQYVKTLECKRMSETSPPVSCQQFTMFFSLSGPRGFLWSAALSLGPLIIAECSLCPRHADTRSLPSWNFWSSDEVEIIQVSESVITQYDKSAACSEGAPEKRPVWNNSLGS